MALSHAQARLFRLRSQRLYSRTPDTARSAADVVRSLCGVQAQDLSAARLAVRARSAGLLAADVEHARLEERSIVRTWAMRGTLHLVAADDLGWMLPLFGPVFIAGNRRRYAQLGLDEETSAKGIRLLRDLLAVRGPLTRAEIVEQLAGSGIRLEGQAAPHLIGRAALEGVICHGPDRDGEPAYVLLEEWVGPGRMLSPDEALAELVRRYLDAYGPATPHDLAAWSGLPMGEVRAAWQRIAAELIEVDLAGSPAWMLATRAGWLDEPPPDRPVVRLLPRFDPYLLGYRGRALAVPPEHEKRIHPGGGMLHPALTVDGWAVAAWRITRHRQRLEVIVEPFETLPESVLPGLEAEVADLGRFLGGEATLQVAGSK